MDKDISYFNDLGISEDTRLIINHVKNFDRSRDIRTRIAAEFNYGSWFDLLEAQVDQEMREYRLDEYNKLNPVYLFWHHLDEEQQRFEQHRIESREYLRWLYEEIEYAVGRKLYGEYYRSLVE